MYPPSRKAAIAVRSRRYYTGKPCLYGHLAERMTISGACMECMRANAKHLREHLREQPSRVA